VGDDLAAVSIVMPGLVPPAPPKPLWRGEGPGIRVVSRMRRRVDGRDMPGHDVLGVVISCLASARGYSSGLRRDDGGLCCASFNSGYHAHQQQAGETP